MTAKPHHRRTLREALLGGSTMFAPAGEGGSKTAVCDGCGYQQHVVGTFAMVAPILRAFGWFIEAERAGAACLCPTCKSIPRN